MVETKINSESAGDALEIHRHVYNAAFYELGLRWHWGANSYKTILPHEQEKDRIRNYLETHQSHLLKAYDVGFLADVIQTTKARCYGALITCGCKGARYLDWAELQKVEIGA